MPARYKIIVVALCFSLTGCAGMFIKTPPIVITESEKIFMIKQGTPVEVWYGKQKLEQTFSDNRFVVTADMLTKMMAKEIEETLGKANAKEEQIKRWAIIGSVLGIVAMILGIIFKKNFWPKISGKIEVK